MKSILLPLLLTTLATSHHTTTTTLGIRKNQIKNLVTFGDSFTDTVVISNGGTQWPVYVSGYTGVHLFPFARSGATCSNNITFRPFPPVFESQIPTFLAEKDNGTIKVPAESTMYSLWIGTNDLGANSIISGGNGASVVDVAGCMVNWVKVLYDHGARNFLFQNMVPLETIPLYAPNSWPNKFWNLKRNTTEWSLFMRQLVLSTNSLTRLMLQDLAPKLHGSHIGIFDSHSLFADMFVHPARYLNGTAPLNVTGAIITCVLEIDSDIGICSEVADGGLRDSYLWFDELHPSEQADRVVAREIANIIQGKGSRWVSWLS